MITRRDVLIAAISVACTACVAAVVTGEKPVIGSSVYDWNSIPTKATNVGEVRQFLRGPTATLDELEIHVTTLNPGQASHPPHKHPNEELVIVKEGTVETLVNGEWKRLGAGSVIFNASNQLHGLRNVGTGPATYHVINWSSPGMLAKTAHP
jgi:XRE family transcriptional regulator, regulator of sulfur utilization